LITPKYLKKKYSLVKINIFLFMKKIE